MSSLGCGKAAVMNIQQCVNCSSLEEQEACGTGTIDMRSIAGSTCLPVADVWLRETTVIWLEDHHRALRSRERAMLAPFLCSVAFLAVDNVHQRLHPEKVATHVLILMSQRFLILA